MDAANRIRGRCEANSLRCELVLTRDYFGRITPNALASKWSQYGFQS